MLVDVEGRYSQRSLQRDKRHMVFPIQAGGIPMSESTGVNVGRLLESAVPKYPLSILQQSSFVRVSYVKKRKFETITKSCTTLLLTIT